MSLNLGSTEIILRKTVISGNIEHDIVCYEVPSDRPNKRKFVGYIPQDFPSGELGLTDSNVISDVIIKIGDTELSENYLGPQLNTPTIPGVIIDNTAPLIKINYDEVDGQDIVLSFDYIADNNILVGYDPSDLDLEIDTIDDDGTTIMGKFRLVSTGGTQSNQGNSNRLLPGMSGNDTYKPGKQYTFSIIAFPYENDKLTYWTNAGYVDAFDHEGDLINVNDLSNKSSEWVRSFIKSKEQTSKGDHNYIPIVKYVIQSDSKIYAVSLQDGSLTPLSHLSSKNNIALTLSSTDVLLEGYTGLYKVYAIASDHIDNLSKFSLVTTSQGDNTIRVLDIEPPIAHLKSAITTSESQTPYIEVKGHVYDLITPINKYIIVTNVDHYDDVHIWSPAYTYDSITADKINAGERLKEIMMEHGTGESNLIYTDSNLGSFTKSLSTYYDGSNVNDITVNASYYVYLLSSETAEGVGGDTETFYQNNVFSKMGPLSFSQQIIESTIEITSDNTTTSNELVGIGGTITLVWKMKFNGSAKNDFTLYLRDNISNAYTIPFNNITMDATEQNRFTATYKIDNAALFDTGLISFYLKYNEEDTPFTESDISTKVYFQKDVPLVYSDGWTVTPDSVTTRPRNTITLNNMFNAIEENITLNNNPYVYKGHPFNLNVQILKDSGTVHTFETFTNVTRKPNIVYKDAYNNQLENQFTIDMYGTDLLTEDTEYEIAINIEILSDVFDIALTNTTSYKSTSTGTDDPIISGILTPGASTGGEMVINNVGCAASDLTSTINMYAFAMEYDEETQPIDSIIYTFVAGKSTSIPDALFVHKPGNKFVTDSTVTSFKHYYAYDASSAAPPALA